MPPVLEGDPFLGEKPGLRGVSVSQQRTYRLFALYPVFLNFHAYSRTYHSSCVS